jgi:hypothetical protein
MIKLENNFAGKTVCSQGKIEKSFSPKLTDYFIQGVRNNNYIPDCKCAVFSECIVYHREYSIFSQRKQILKKEANIVKGARVCYCRIYHKLVNFIILNLFKVVK